VASRVLSVANRSVPVVSRAVPVVSRDFPVASRAVLVTNRAASVAFRFIIVAECSVFQQPDVSCSHKTVRYETKLKIFCAFISYCGVKRRITVISMQKSDCNIVTYLATDNNAFDNDKASENDIGPQFPRTRPQSLPALSPPLVACSRGSHELGLCQPRAHNGGRTGTSAALGPSEQDNPRTSSASGEI
jgi:hypothetical protein